MAAKLFLWITALVLVGSVAFVRFQAARQEARVEAAYPPEGRILDVDGVRVHAVVKGQGPDVVVVHGAGGMTRDYTFAIADLISDRYRVILIDRPGLGYTERLPGYGAVFSREAETPIEQAALLRAAAAQLGAERPIVLGHSYGGAVALAWAVSQPAALSALVMVAGAANEWEGGLGPLYRITASPLGGAFVVPLLTAFVPDWRIRQSGTGVFRPQAAPEGYADHFGPRLSARRETLRANGRQVNGLKPHIIAMVP